MAGTENQPKGNGGRLAAYTARNRAALVKSAQEVLAEIGLGATIEQLAVHAQVSPATIYNYFESKELLFGEALETVWQEWVLWAYDGAPVGENLQSMLGVCRKLFRAKETNPLFAKILNKTLDNPAFVIKAVSAIGMSDLKRATAAEGFAQDNFEEQVYLWAYCLAGILHRVHVTGESSPEHADNLLALSLELLGVSKAKAKKLVPQPPVSPS